MLHYKNPMDMHVFWFTNRSKKIGYNSQDQRSSFVTVYPHVVKGHPQIIDWFLSPFYIYINILYIYNCYILIFHSVVPNVSATARIGAAAGAV